MLDNWYIFIINNAIDNDAIGIAWVHYKFMRIWLED